MQSDHFQVIPSAGGVNLYFGNKRTADGMEPEQGRRVTYGERYEDSGEVWAREEYASVMRAEGRQPDLGPMNVSKYWTHRAIEEIKADPAAWVRLELRKCWLMLWNTEIPNNKSFAFLQTEFVWLGILPIRWVVLLMLAPAGIWVAARWGNRDALFVLLVYLAVYSAGNVLFFICDRYRYPLWPVMAAIAGGGLVAFVQSFHRTRREMLGLTAVMALMAAISLPNWLGVKLPSFARDYLFRSIAWYEKGQFPRALADADRSLALDPGEVTALHHRGNVLLALGQFGDACQSYEQALKTASDDAGIWNNYAIALDGTGQTNAALQAFGRAIHCTPPSQSAFLGLAFDLVRLGRFDEAAATLDQSRDSGAVALALRSVLARKHGDNAQADALEKQARATDPDATAWALKRAGS
jgi:tetratricopeptide (TPR) repeat protein